MADFSQIIETLRGQEQEFESQLTKVRAAREALENTSGTPAVAVPTPAGRGRRPGRPPGTAKRAPGRPRKAAPASTGTAKSTGRRGRRSFSPETRAKMAAAQKARWAKARSEQAKK